MPSESQQESTSENMVGGSLEELRQTFEKLTTEYGKFSGKSNKAAGRRARKEAQNMKKLLQNLRVEILDGQKKMPTKKKSN